jgi:hypothetical protein
VTVVLAHFLKPGGMLIVVDFRAGTEPPSDNQKLFEERARDIMAHRDGMSETAMGAAFENAELDKYELKDISHAKLMGKDVILFMATGVKKL